MAQLIYQVYVGKRSRLYDWCTKSVKEYAERIGADYKCQTQPLLRIKPDIFSTNRSKESYEKHGGDIYIRPDAPDIFFELEPEYDFGAVVEATMPMTPEYRQKILNYSRMQYGTLKMPWSYDDVFGFPFMNMGLMVLNKKWIRKEQMNIKKLDWKWNALYTACTRVREAHFVHFFLKDKLPNRGENIEQLEKDIRKD